MPKISVIIPVYNAKDYLSRCLDSVCNQTLKDIEIICVNDCSTDNSLEILNDYAQKFSNLKVINCEKNGGESVARNIGLEAATGEYLGFVDNDDAIDLDFYEKLYNKAIEENADISKGELHEIGYDLKEGYGNLNKTIRNNNSLLFFNYHWWTAIYKTSLVKGNGIKFIEGYPLGGDVLFLNQVVLVSSKISLIDDVFYHYYRREDSGDSKVLSFEKIKSALDIHEMIVDNVLQSQKFKSFSKEELDFLFIWCLNATLTYCYRCKTIPVLEFCINKAFVIYKKVADYIHKNTPLIYPVCMHILENGNEEKLKQLFLINDTHQKMFLANLRFLHTRKGKKMPKVSVIIPIYNVELYLSQCLDSVCHQTFSDIEIVCVNDCSPDNSLEILQKYAQKDKRIKIINREKNGGLSAARNTGLGQATGVYVYFLDSDDWIDADYIEHMVKAAETAQVDIVLNTNIFYEFEGQSPASRQHLPYLAANYVENAYLPSQENIYNVMWNSCCHFFKRDLLLKYNLKFPEGYTSEDLYFQAITYPYTDKIYVIRSGRYHYRMRQDSICGNYKQDELKQLKANLAIFKLVLAFYRERGLLEKINVKFFTHLFPQKNDVPPQKTEVYAEIKQFFSSIKPYVEKNKQLYYKSELKFFSDILENFEQALKTHYTKLYYFDIIRTNRGL